MILNLILRYVLPDLLDITKLKRDIVDILSFLRSSDFDNKSGINESGFKLSVICAILKQYDCLNNDCKYMLESERKVKLIDNKNGYIDLILKTKDDTVLYVIELKYIRLGYISNSEFKSKAPIKRFERDKLESRRNEFNDLNTNVKDLNVKVITGYNAYTNNYDTKTCTVLSYSKNALIQSEKYINGYQSMISIKNKIINNVAIIGVGNKVFINQRLIHDTIYDSFVYNVKDTLFNYTNAIMCIDLTITLTLMFIFSYLIHNLFM